MCSNRVLIGLPKSSAHAIFKISSESDKTSDSLLAKNPALFILASEEGFSGEAWLEVNSPNYDLPELTEAPHWLRLDVEELGETFTRFTQTGGPTVFQVADKLPASASALKLFAASDPGKTQSLFRAEGDLKRRTLLSAPQLVSWPHPELLSDSVVQTAVGESGEIISARLLERSGLSAADQKAIEIVRNLSFAPIPVETNAAPQLTWGRIIFQWFTIPITMTN
ncbi:MAG: energy transducer TonB family protein, partial [Limisphaerales bacterium]